ncbi:MAG: leucine-rich repeat domain-containing protein [Oscillospiraceae bacterium]|jgi:hypothetical protein|nr:leucine-rich repeat domain-containing protein [Oscillospiraceae bacterium]
MKYNRKRIVAAIMSFAMVAGTFTYFPADTGFSIFKQMEISAANSMVTSLIDSTNPGYVFTAYSDGTATITDYTDTTSTNIEIPSKLTYSGSQYTVTSIGERAFLYCENLVTINIPEGVTSIEDKAFYDCLKLTEITIPSTVTTIGNNAFYSCNKLETVTFAENSQLREITAAFVSCSALKSIVLPEGLTTITSTSTDMGNGSYQIEGSFDRCTSLEPV